MLPRHNWRYNSASGLRPKTDSYNRLTRSIQDSAAHLIATLTKAHGEGRLEEKLKLYTTPRLLMIDEIGYLPTDRQGANLFFQLISRRYERGLMILTRNRSFGV